MALGIQSWWTYSCSLDRL